MQMDAILCNHVEAVNNLLYMAGGGIGVAHVPPGASPPYQVTLGIGMVVTVPWEKTNQQHKVEIELLGADGESVLLPTGPDTTSALQFVLAFNVGRGPDLPIGDDQRICLATNMPGLPIPALGRYEFVVRLDGHDERRLPLRVEQAGGAQIPFPLGFGPADHAG